MNSPLKKLLDEFPPCLCRILAKDSNRPRTAQRIAELSGLSIEVVKRVSLLPGWGDTPTSTTLSFMGGCGVNPLKARRLRSLVRRGRYGHLSNLSPRRLRYYKKLINILTSSRQ